MVLRNILVFRDLTTAVLFISLIEAWLFLRGNLIWLSFVLTLTYLVFAFSKFLDGFWLFMNWTFYSLTKIALFFEALGLSPRRFILRITWWFVRIGSQRQRLSIIFIKLMLIRSDKSIGREGFIIPVDLITPVKLAFAEVGSFDRRQTLGHCEVFLFKIFIELSAKVLYFKLVNWFVAKKLCLETFRRSHMLWRSRGILLLKNLRIIFEFEEFC